MSGFPYAMLWPAFKAAGMLHRAEIALANGETKCIEVGFVSPDVEKVPYQPGRGTLSREYEIEYQAQDAPALREGDEVFVTGQLFPDGASFVVRQPPTIDPVSGADGFYRRAKLKRPTA